MLDSDFGLGNRVAAVEENELNATGGSVKQSA